MYDYLIIGKGMFGSAAARYLSQASDSVCIIGPDEPADWDVHSGPFASHYDEARVVSVSAPNELWTTLDRDSIAQYRPLEEASGISFFSDPGRLCITPANEEFPYPYLTAGDTYESYEPSNLPDKFPFHFPSDYTVRYEAGPSGYLNPRAMVQAQLKMAQQQGTVIVSDVVEGIDDKSTHITVSLTGGETVEAKKVLIATGAYANCFGLLPKPLALDIEMTVTVLVEVQVEQPNQYAHWPPINYLATDSPLTHVTILPPLPYPDGQTYMKLVIYSDYTQFLSDFDSIQAWFKNEPDFPYLAEVKSLIQQMMPDLPILSWQVKPCVVSYTPSLDPMIDAIIPGRVYIAVGCNGMGAHPSDAIGKLTADFIRTDVWPSDLPQADFKAQFVD